MGRLKRIENIINSTISHYSHVKVMPRGLPRFVDSLLRGTIRFAKRTGNSISLLNPDNTFALESVPQARDNKIVLKQSTGWITTGCIISIGPGKEIHRVYDVVDNVIFIEDQVQGAFTLDDKILLHSYPMLSSIDTVINSQEILVKAHHPLANGDTFSYLLSEELLQSLTEIKISQVVYLGATTDPFYKLLYRLELESPVDKAILGNTQVYMRAFPAYFSSTIRVPKAFFTSEPMGPFLIDILSGRLLEGPEFNETLAIRTLDRSGNYIAGDVSNYITTDKNYLVLDRNIPAHTPMFWEIAEGSMKLTPNRVVLAVDPLNKKFNVGTKCIPHLQSGFNWKVNLVSNEDCTIRFIFPPNDLQEFDVVAGISKNISITTGTQEVTDIEINVTSNANNCQVQLNEWSSANNLVDQIEYSFVSEAQGTATYQASGLIIKPYFIGSEFLKASYDESIPYDSGKIYF